MNRENCSSKFAEDTKTSREVDKGNLNSRIILRLSALAVGTVLFLIILFVFIFFKGNVSKPDDKMGYPLFYTKNEKVYYTSTDKIAPVEVIPSTEKIIGRYFGSEDIFSIRVSEDGRKLFYPNNIDLKSDEYYSDIFCCNLASKKHETIKIDSGINNYVSNQDGTKVYFLKNKDLYISDLSNKKKIAAGIQEFCIDKKGDRLMYVTLDSRLFEYTNNNNEAKEIASNARLQYASPDLKLVYYFNGNDLYLLKDGKDTQKVAAGVTSVLNIYEDESLYYYKTHPIKISDYVNDDMAALDAQMKEPKESDYPDKQAYSDACNKFTEKTARDELRQILKNDGIEEAYSLYYYSNGKSTVVSEYCGYVWTDYNKIKLMPNYTFPAYCGKDKPLLIYYKLKADKINLSDITEYTDIYSDIMSRVQNNLETYVCSRSEVLSKIADKQASPLEYDIGNNKIYYAVKNYDNMFSNDLYDVTIDGSTISKARKYAENVQTLPNCLSVGGSVIYIKSEGSSHLGGDLYINNEKIDHNVEHLFYKIKNTNSFIYTTNNQKRIYTLKLYQDGKTTEIADNVSIFQYCDDNKIAYVVGAPGKNTAKLYLYDIGSQESQLVDSEMSGIIRPVENSYYGYNRSTYPAE